MFNSVDALLPIPLSKIIQIKSKYMHAKSKAHKLYLLKEAKKLAKITEEIAAITM